MVVVPPSPTAVRLLDAALVVLGERGARDLTVRAAEDAAGVPHGSIRHHFGDRRGLLIALFDHLEQTEAQGSPTTTATTRTPAATPDVTGALVDAIEGWLGAGRTVALARYELFLLAARDPELRPSLVRARERFAVRAAAVVGAGRAPSVVAAIDGLVLDALVRGTHDRAALTDAVDRLLAT